MTLPTGSNVLHRKRRGFNSKRKRHLKYEPHLIAYIDIMGFSELVKNESPDFISRAIRRVTEVTAPDVDDRKAYQENYVSFSDLIVHTIPIVPRANENLGQGIVFSEILNLAAAQASLIDDGLLIRGALTIGELERTYGVLFGPGIIAAYHLDQEKAVFPRIVVDPAIFETLKKVPSMLVHPYEEEITYIFRLLKRDDDGVIFIDYLGSMQSERRDYLEFLKNHKELVEKNIAKFKADKRVLSKYLWLKKYHNAVIHARLK